MKNRKCNLKLFLEWSRYDRGKKIFDIVILLSTSEIWIQNQVYRICGDIRMKFQEEQ